MLRGASVWEGERVVHHLRAPGRSFQLPRSTQVRASTRPTLPRDLRGESTGRLAAAAHDCVCAPTQPAVTMAFLPVARLKPSVTSLSEPGESCTVLPLVLRDITVFQKLPPRKINFGSSANSSSSSSSSWIPEGEAAGNAVAPRSALPR